MTDVGANLDTAFAREHLKTTRVFDLDAPLSQSHFRALRARVEPTTYRRDFARVVPT